MITKNTALQIYNTYQQLGEIESIKQIMIEQIEAEKEEKSDNKYLKNEDSQDKCKWGQGMRLEVPDSAFHSSYKVYNVSASTSLIVLEEHERMLNETMSKLQALAKSELNENQIDENF